MAADNPIIPRRALLSVFDKTGLLDLARGLHGMGVELVSSGGTARALSEAGLPVIEVGDYTAFPEILDGRVKTLHPKIHGGILGRRSLESHRATMAAHDIGEIDLVVVNLYPFEATIASGADYDHAVENIDIGGPAMIRSAAKNHADVAVLVRPEDYAAAMEELSASGGLSLTLRKRLAATAYARTAAYDSAIAAWFARQIDLSPAPYLTVGGPLISGLRYGENPHQSAAFYAVAPGRPGVASARMLQGKDLSYNNINDTDAAFELAAEFTDPAVVIVKHANPCGVAIAATVEAAFRDALAADPVSAFGGIVAANRKIDAATARAIAALFAEVVIAPDYDDDALAILGEKKALRVLATGSMPDPTEPGLTVRSVAGGLLTQSRDDAAPAEAQLKTVTQRAPTAAETKDLLIAARIAKHVKSNAIVLVRGGRSVGVGGGQTSRVDAARQAVERAALFAREAGEAQSRAVGAVVAGDAFFPFADGLQLCLEAGVTAAITPGGSKRDAEVIEAADKAHAAMVFSGLRGFRH
jgi:phosphoribosylaminoimidazolecarboxamide formyltransferase/IMP cyclohydrolase